MFSYLRPVPTVYNTLAPSTLSKEKHELHELFDAGHPKRLNIARTTDHPAAPDTSSEVSREPLTTGLLSQELPSTDLAWSTLCAQPMFITSFVTFIIVSLFLLFAFTTGSSDRPTNGTDFGKCKNFQ